MTTVVTVRRGTLQLAGGIIWIVSALLMTGILIGGLILHQGRIGEEGFLLLIYGGALAIQFLVGKP